MSDFTIFKQHIIESGILDPEDLHHEFVSGMHGRKLDFDAIPGDGPLFGEWVDAVVAAIQEFFPAEKLKNVVVVSVANGTNRLVPFVADKLGNGASYLITDKATPKSAKLSDEAAKKLPELLDRFFVVVEDVGTKGTTSASVVQALRAAGAKDIEVINTWQRREHLEELEAIDVPHHAIITDMMETYSPEDCALCAAGSELIEHAK